MDETAPQISTIS